MLSIVLTLVLVQATYLDRYQDALFLREQGKVREAAAALSQSLDLNKDYLPALRESAEVNVTLKRLPQAIQQYEQFVLRSPKDANARGRLAELYSWVGNHDKAIVLYREALALDAGNGALKTGLAKVLRWDRRYDEAIALYREVLEGEPAQYDALRGLSKTYALLGDFGEARKILGKAAKIYPDDADLYNDFGSILAWQGKYREAIAMLQKAVALAPNHGDSYQTMGDVYYWMKAYQEAIEAYHQALRIAPDDAQSHVMLAKAYGKTGNSLLAGKHLQNALSINPVHTEANELLRAMADNAWFPLLNRFGQVMEFITALFVFLLVFINYRRNRRILRHKHKIYSVFANGLLPALALFTVFLYAGEGALSRWFVLDDELIHSAGESVLLLLFGVFFLTFLAIDRKPHHDAERVILAIGAHPDDIELGCGGYLLKAKDGGAKIYGIILTTGERGIERGGSARRYEQVRAAHFIAFDDFWVYDFPDTRIKERHRDVKEVIEAKIRETGATTILTHTPIDIHSDHKAAFEATNEAARNGASVYCYEDVSTPKEFVPNYYSDISGYIDEKIRLIAFHKTQEHKVYMDPESIRGRAAHRGLQSGIQYAEAFRVHRIVQ